MNYENKLKNETSPYLLQHASNPVYWYPWCEEALQRADKEDKPVFLSIGYSTCHWCHVMAHECFEDKKVADILNEYFISIKVDKEERPDIDSIYMNVCQLFTGSGGWPTTIFMTPDQKPFFAGTYFPKESQGGMIGFIDLLSNISKKWIAEKEDFLQSSDEIMDMLNEPNEMKPNVTEDSIENAVGMLKNAFDNANGGFGSAPKFPTPHNLLFLMNYYKQGNDKNILAMVEKTLIQMYRGGIFDHIGFGFSRYSTDAYFLVPHFEKMLYDNALLIMSYVLAYDITKNKLYSSIAEKTAQYVLRELTNREGGFYCAQDADSDGVEGKYYVFEPEEIINILGDEIGNKFNDYYDITPNGNFEGKNIPNLLFNNEINNNFDQYLPQIYKYRKNRAQLHVDDKVLTSWNSLMIAAFAMLYRILGSDYYLRAAEQSCKFLAENLSDEDNLFVSYRNGKVSGNGFLDDYAFYIYALINMYEATLDEYYLDRAIVYSNKAIDNFYDSQNNGFYLYGHNNEQLILKPKETYDGAIPSGNSVMTYNLIKLSAITNDSKLEIILKKQIAYMSSAASKYPAGNGFYLGALLMLRYPLKYVVCVLKDEADKEKIKIPLNTNIKILHRPTEEYKLVNDKTTFYVCENYSCKPPTNKMIF